jgi:hypothetical protein
MEACGEDYKLTEKQKVAVFVRGLQSEEYVATKHSILQNPETRADFQKCYSFVETMERFHPFYLDPNSFNRNISETSQRGANNHWKSPEEWAALSKEEKSKITAAQQWSRNGKGRKGKKPKPSKQKLEAAITTAAEAITALAGESTATTSGNSSISATGTAPALSNSPGDQFGRRTQELKKF